MPLFGPPDVAKMKAERDVKGLIKALEYRKDSGTRKYAAVFLGGIGDPRAVEPLTAALEDTDKDVRQAAAVSLGRSGDPRAVEPLAAALTDTDKDVRQAVAQALGAMQDSRAFEPLIALLDEPFESVKAGAIDALGKLSDPRAVEPLVALLGDESRMVRASAVFALGRIDDPRAVEPLMALLGDSEPSVRATLAIVLGQMGDPQAMEGLITALSDPVAAVREKAAQSLSKMGPTLPISDQARATQALEEFHRRGGAAVPSEVVPTAAGTPSRRAYAIVLLGASVFGDPWSDAHSGSLVRQQAEQLGYPVRFLGSVDCIGPFPTGADTYVIGTSLRACEKYGIPFESSRDQIIFQPVSRSGRQVALITIVVSVEEGSEAADAPTKPTG